jgi:hypothetical protein
MSGLQAGYGNDHSPDVQHQKGEMPEMRISLRIHGHCHDRPGGIIARPYAFPGKAFQSA